MEFVRRMCKSKRDSTYSTEPVVSQDGGEEEPDDELATEEGLQEAWYFGWRLAVVVWKTVEHEVAEEETQDGQRENGDADVPRWDVAVWSSIQRVTPVP